MTIKSENPAVAKPACFVDATRVATLLQFGSEERAAHEVVRDALRRFGVLRQLLAPAFARAVPRCMPPDDERRLFAEIQTALQTARRLLPQDSGLRPGSRSPPPADATLAVLLHDLEQEIFGYLYLDRRARSRRWDCAPGIAMNDAGIRVRDAAQRTRLSAAMVTSWT